MMSFETSRASRGFSLVEMIVAVGLFAVVMVISISALLALIDANRKARALESVMNNLNIALDGMVRSIRMGRTFHCGAGTLTDPASCPSGADQFAFEAFEGSSADNSDQWVYAFDTDPNTGKGRLYRSQDSGGHWYAITAPEITIDDMKFYVVGTAKDTDSDGTTDDVVQPKVVIVIKGTAGADKVRTRATFSIQATAVQRVLDL